MNIRPKWFIEFSAILNDIVFMFCGYVIFTTLRADGLKQIAFYPWLVYCFFVYVFNNILISRGIKENTYLTINIIFGVIAIVFGAIFFVDANSIISFLCASCFIGLSVLRCYILPKDGIKPNQMLVYVEFSVMIFCVVLMIEKSLIEIRGVISPKFLVSTTCSLISLILIRVTSEYSKKYTGGKFTGIFVLGSIIAISGTFVLGFILILSDGFRYYMTLIVNGFFSAFEFLKDKLIEFLVFLFSHGSAPEQELNISGGNEFVNIAESQGTLDSDKLFYIIGTIVVICAIVFLLKIFKANKNKRLAGVVLSNSQSINKTSLPSLIEQVKFILKKIFLRIRFFINSIIYKNSIEGFYLELIKFGDKKKINKIPSETPREFIVKICEIVDESDRNLFIDFANILERNYYSNESQRIEKSFIKNLRLALYKN